MANIPYRSAITFTDWAHGFVDGSSANNWNMYQVNGQSWGTTRYQTVADSTFPTGSAINNLDTSEMLDSTWGNPTSSNGSPPGFSSLTENKFTFSIWVKYLNTVWDNSSNILHRKGIFGMMPQSYQNPNRNCLGMGFYEANQTIVKVRYYMSSISSSDSNTFNVATYTLPDNGTKLQWHHYAVTYDGSKMYFFVDGKLIYSETPANPGAFGWCSFGTDSSTHEEKRYFNDYYLMKDICLWTEDFEPPDAPLYEKYAMKNIGGSGWTPPPLPPAPKQPVTNILKVY